MIFTISDGSQKDIVVGSRVLVRPGYLPRNFDGQWITITAVHPEGPYAPLEDVVIDDPETDINAQSCISPQIITMVV